jgi:hypothetical protein
VKIALVVALLVAPAVASAQRPVAMTSVRHGPEKVVVSLDWVARFDPLPAYVEWWRDISRCSGITLPAARVDSVEFLFVNAPEFVPVPMSGSRRMVSGVTYAGSEQIVLSLGRVKDRVQVLHEMLHQLLYWAGDPGWADDARPEFARCGVTLEAVRSSPLAGSTGP